MGCFAAAEKQVTLASSDPRSETIFVALEQYFGLPPESTGGLLRRTVRATLVTIWLGAGPRPCTKGVAAQLWPGAWLRA